MPTLTVVQNGIVKKIEFEGDTPLSKLLGESELYVEHPCGGRGACKKCEVTVDGKKELSCQYIARNDATVILPDNDNILSVTGAVESGRLTENICLCLDIGTTTLALALVSLDESRVIKTLTAKNPQRRFGADVISRIDYCSKNGVAELQSCLVESLNDMISELFGAYGLESVDKMYTAGNTTMLHLLFGEDCSSIGVAPYTPKFLESRCERGDSLGLEGVSEVISLPNIAAFVGADIVAGLGFVGAPSEGRYSLLVDLGTNAEIVLFGKGKYICATAAAGPCFEGANISCGMSATEGAIYEYLADGSYSVIGGGIPTGLCATGLIDLISELCRREEIDESGYMENGEFSISDAVSLTPDDVREFQLAKSAVLSAIQCLVKRAGISFEDIEAMFVAGGFSAKLNIANAAYLGLLPQELADKFVPINNASLLGTQKYACEGNSLTEITERAEFIDIGADSLFSEFFFENMGF
ncbi:MAG: DUF4445 domain-containing protein [Clostridia bacterium]|nr:DUF4445 domain-containing protein [Clostridia bacterium]